MNHRHHNTTESISPMSEFSQYFGFLIIFKESIKIIFKNAKFMAAVTLLLFLVPSLLLIVFCYIHQTLINYLVTNIDSDSSYLSPIACLLLLFITEIIAILAFAKISKLSVLATILVSATSYTDTPVMSSQDLYSRVKKTSNRSKLFYRPAPNRGMVIVATSVWMVILVMAMFYHNPITIAIAVVVGVSLLAFELYSSVATVLSMVVSVVEEKYEGSELDKAEELIEGQRYDGFMVNLFNNLPSLIASLVIWLVLGDRFWSVNALGFWLILVGVFTVARIYGCVANTVLYFRCKEYHGADEEVGGLGKLAYSKLPNSNLDAAANIP